MRVMSLLFTTRDVNEVPVVMFHSKMVMALQGFLEDNLGFVGLLLYFELCSSVIIFFKVLSSPRTFDPPRPSFCPLSPVDPNILIPCRSPSNRWLLSPSPVSVRRTWIGCKYPSTSPASVSLRIPSVTVQERTSFSSKTRVEVASQE